MLQDIDLFSTSSPPPPTQDYFKAHAPRSEVISVALCTLCRAGSSQNCLCSRSQTWVYWNRTLMEILPQSPGERRLSRRWAGIWEALRLLWCWSLCCSPWQTWLVFELSEAFDTGISHPCWAGRPCVSECLHTEGNEKPFKIRSLCVTELVSPHARRISGHFISHRIWVCHREAPVSLFCCLEGHCYAAASQQCALFIVACVSFISMLSERLLI